MLTFEIFEEFYEKDDWTQYTERFENYIGKKRATLLSSCGAIRNLVAPQYPTEKSS